MAANLCSASANTDLGHFPSGPKSTDPGHSFRFNNRPSLLCFGDPTAVEERKPPGAPERALWLAILYAFGTPVFLRTGYLNQNMMLGHIAFWGFLAMWNPTGSERWSTRARFVLGGLAGGTAILFDYSGGVLLAGLFVYGFLKRFREAAVADAVRHAVSFGLGAAGPILVLWFYQYEAFGNPFLPGQHWMPPVEWIDRGYQGVSGPQLELVWRLAFDYRFGIFVTCPLFLLALASPWAWRNVRHRVPPLELATMLAFFGAQTSVVWPGIFMPMASIDMVVRQRSPGVGAWATETCAIASDSSAATRKGRVRWFMVRPWDREGVVGWSPGRSARLSRDGSTGRPPWRRGTPWRRRRSAHRHGSASTRHRASAIPRTGS